MPDDDDLNAQSVRRQISEVAFIAGVGAALMLFTGFYLNLEGIDDSRVYNLAVNGFTWMMKVGGVLMGLVAIMLYIGWRPALIVDAVLTIGVGVLMLVVGGVWLAKRDVEGILVLMFAILFLRSGWGSWVLHRRLPASRSDNSAPWSPEIPDDSAAREAAMAKLLGSRRRERPIESPTERTKPATSPAGAPPTSAPDASPPGGFLAQLGRGESQKK